MLDNAPYYFHSIRNLVVAFGDVFNTVQTTKEDGAGNVVSSLTVPIAFSRRQKYLARILEDQQKNEDSSAAKVELSLPRMSYDIASIDRNPGQQLSPHNLQIREITTNNVQDFLRQMSGSPITIGFDLTIYTYSLDEMLQIIEQIIPVFVPDFNVTILDIPELDIRKDVPLTMEAINPSDSFEGPMDEYRIIEWSISFSSKMEIYPPIKQGGIIRRVITTYREHEDKKLVTIQHELNPFETVEIGPTTGAVTDIVFFTGTAIASTTTDLSVFNDGDFIEVIGTEKNDGVYTVSGTPTATTLLVAETTLIAETPDETTISYTYKIDTTHTIE